jgi:hypothetical protein
VWHFEDVKTSMVELRKRLLNMLYIWITSHHSMSVLIYFLFVPIRSTPVYFMCITVAPLCALLMN